MALTMWDNAKGATREVTQEDVDVLQVQATALARLTFGVSVIEVECKGQIKEIQKRYELSKRLSGDA